MDIAVDDVLERNDFMKILDYLKNNYLIFDGAMGSLLQQEGLKAGELPELLNVTRPELIQKIHYNYLEAGSNVVLTNTFGANPLKIKNEEYSLAKIIECAINNAREAVNKVDKQAFVAYDIGPLGQLLKPSGQLSFQEAYEAFKEVVVEASKYDIDVFVVETISDLAELRAAVLAIKENSKKPVFTSMTFEQDQRSLVGNEIASVVATLEGLKVDALGLNCGFGPKQMLPLVQEFAKWTSLPLMVQPNAGLPILDGETIKFDIDENDFLAYMKAIIAANVQIVGGCCGTSYNHIRLLANYVKTLVFKQPTNKELTIVASAMKAVVFDESKLIKIGERINPTGKKLLAKALKDKDYDYVIKEAIKQEEEGADVIDVNVGVTDANEVELMGKNIEQIQSYVKTPIQIDSSNVAAIEAALRIYNGKAIVNSVNGKKESMEAILPLVAKYGGLVIGLCLDEQGLAFSIEDKLRIAKKIVTKANEYGISNKDILIDTLTLTASAQQEDVKATIDAITIIKKELGVKCVLGVSNVSFGLPNRDLITSSFICMSAFAGLDACIINTGSPQVMNAIAASEVLLNKDKNATNYISLFQDCQKDNNSNNSGNGGTDLKSIIIKGLKGDVIPATKKQLETRPALDIIDNDIVKALNYVGEKFEKKELFLPQLIQAAQTVSLAFEEIKKQMDVMDEDNENKIVLATVKGDVHDIGKNIVKVLLENYGYDVIDLGKDVYEEDIVKALKTNNCSLLGLSALMTTTIKNMEEIIIRVKKELPNVKIMVGGAVLTKDYSLKIGADFYCEDALKGVSVAKEHFHS